MQDSFNDKIDDVSKFITRMYRNNQQKHADSDLSTTQPIQGIIYCRKRETCDQVAGALRCKGLNAAAFHRGLTTKACEKAAEKWQNAHDLASKGNPYIDIIGKRDMAIHAVTWVRL